MPGSSSTAPAESSTSTSAESQKPSYWAHMLSHYEKRNASLEQRQSELAERIRLMECAVPSLLMGAMVSMKRNTDPSAKLSSTPKTGEQASHRDVRNAAPDGKEVQNSNGNDNTGLRRTVRKSELNRFCRNTDFRP